MASYKKLMERRTRRCAASARIERESNPMPILPDFLVRIVGWERLRTYSTPIVLRNWHD